MPLWTTPSPAPIYVLVLTQKKWDKGSTISNVHFEPYKGNIFWKGHSFSLTISLWVFQAKSHIRWSYLISGTLYPSPPTENCPFFIGGLLQAIFKSFNKMLTPFTFFTFENDEWRNWEIPKNEESFFLKKYFSK